MVIQKLRYVYQVKKECGHPKAQIYQVEEECGHQQAQKYQVQKICFIYKLTYTM